MRLLIAGSGFLGGKIAQLLTARGDTVVALRRSAQHTDASTAEQIACDLNERPAELKERHFDAGIFCLAPGARGAADEQERYHKTYILAQENFLRSADFPRYVYISSTAVYPDVEGEFTENMAVAHSARAAQLLKAEEIALAHANAVVLRLAGLYSAERPIYGPTRSLFSDDRFVHFLHRDDAARAVLHAIDTGLSGVYNVHDGHPLRRSEILKTHAVPVSGLPLKRFISAVKFHSTPWHPQYPDYFAGVAETL